VIRRNDHLIGNPLLGAGAVHHIKTGHSLFEAAWNFVF